MKNVAKLFVGAAVAAVIGGGTAIAQPAADPVAAGALGQSIASAAAGAERGAAGVEAIERSVTAAAQGVIIASAADPRVVLAALDRLMVSCRAAPVTQGWVCPTNGASFTALNSLRTIVVAQLEQGAPAALGTRGFAAFGSIPTTSAGGASYIRP